MSGWAVGLAGISRWRCVDRLCRSVWDLPFQVVELVGLTSSRASDLVSGVDASAGRRLPGPAPKGMNPMSAVGGEDGRQAILAILAILASMAEGTGSSGPSWPRWLVISAELDRTLLRAEWILLSRMACSARRTWLEEPVGWDWDWEFLSGDAGPRIPSFDVAG